MSAEMKTEAPFGALANDDALPSVKPAVAFVLGGLGGSNAHGVGFLAAARQLGIKPDMVSATSGMIHWLWRYLDGADLRAELEESIRARHPFDDWLSPMNLPFMMMLGMPGVFRPALLEHMLKLWKFNDKFGAGKAPHEHLFDIFMPAQSMVAMLEPAKLNAIADCFNDQSVPVIFNSFEPKEGVEHLHMNEAAQYMYRHSPVLGNRWRKRRKNKILPEVVAEPISPEAVADALWLTMYGFGEEKQQRSRIDGAYIRQLIITELYQADLIFVARPMSYNWKGHLPKNYFELKDFETELWFNGSYAQQVQQIDFINRLYKIGAVDRQLLHKTKVVPIEIKQQRGFFDYFKEDLSVFDDSLIRSAKKLRKKLLKPAKPLDGAEFLTLPVAEAEPDLFDAEDDVEINAA